MPAVIVRVTGGAPLSADRFELQRLRCNLCGKVFTAKAPPEAQGPKYDEAAAAMIALLRYGSGLPHNRLERLQQSLGVPHPIDPGLIPVFDRSGKANLGHALETAVRIELERRRMDVHYVRTPAGFEVDFIARRPDAADALIQVAAELDDEATVAREVRALLDAREVHPQASLELITLTPEAARGVPVAIQVRDAALWLLDVQADDEGERRGDIRDIGP